jgi:hypothetical protein
MELTRSFISIAQTAAQQQAQQPAQQQHNTACTVEIHQPAQTQKSASVVSMSMFEFSGHRSVG